MSGQTHNIYTSSKEIEKLLHEIATDEDFNEYTIERVGGSMKGEGYMGIITGVKIVGKDKADKNKVVNLVIKSAPESDALRSEIAVENLFRREVYMYDTVFKAFQMLELEKGLPPYHFSPKFYKAQVANIPEALILENLRENGYKLYERNIPMDDNHVTLVMTEYGRVHALSFALRDQNPEKYNQIVESMDNHFVENITKNNFIENFIQRCVKAQKSLNSETDKEAITVYERFLTTIKSFFEDLAEPIANYTVGLHGDCWTNNMMFKYANEEDKPTSLRFFDFQISTQGSPVLDLSYFFYTCSEKKIFNNLNHYLDLYYDSFSTYLQKLGSDPKKMFPYSVLQDHWKRYSRYGLIFSALVIHVMLTENEELIDFADVSESGKSVANAFDYEIGNFEQYKERLRPIILHFVENNFI